MNIDPRYLAITNIKSNNNLNKYEAWIEYKSDNGLLVLEDTDDNLNAWNANQEYSNFDAIQLILEAIFIRNKLISKIAEQDPANTRSVGKLTMPTIIDDPDMYNLNVMTLDYKNERPPLIGSLIISDYMMEHKIYCLLKSLQNMFPIKKKHLRDFCNTKR